MRDAFGGAFSIKLMLIFLILYVSFICVALNYARAFRVKNRIINIIEQNEGYPTDASSRTNINEQINSYLSSTGYYISYDDTKNSKKQSISSCDASFFNGNQGFCIKENNSTLSDAKYYLVETYMVFKLPIINVNFPIAIKGETRIVEKMTIDSISKQSNNII